MTVKPAAADADEIIAMLVFRYSDAACVSYNRSIFLFLIEIKQNMKNLLLLFLSLFALCVSVLEYMHKSCKKIRYRLTKMPKMSQDHDSLNNYRVIGFLLLQVHNAPGINSNLLTKVHFITKRALAGH